LRVEHLRKLEAQKVSILCMQLLPSRFMDLALKYLLAGAARDAVDASRNAAGAATAVGLAAGS
jgi:hypothetical protein